jgi:hypothetical protein
MNGMCGRDNDRDADMSDVDAEGEENFDDLPSAEQAQIQGRAPEAPMGMIGRQRYGNGNNKSETRHDGTNRNGNGSIEIDGMGRQYCGNRVMM